MQYGSTIANIFSILAWNFLMIVFTLIILLVKFLSKIFCDNMRCSCMIKALNCIFDKLYRMLIFAYFIRNVLELSQFFLISSINEVYENNTTDIYRLISFIFSIIVIFLYISIIGVVLYLVLSSYKLSENKHNKLEEFFRGLKQERKHRLYVAILLCRRLVFVILIITCVLLMSRILAAILTIIQVAYIVLLSFIRPYEGTKGNLIEILNEIYFAFLILFLSIINTESDWSSIKTNFYMWVIVSNTFVVFIIVFGYFLKDIIRCIRNKCCRNENNINEVVRINPKQHQTNDLAIPKSRVNNNQSSLVNSEYIVSNHLKEESKSNLNQNISEMNFKI